ncbi:MAG: hypothetical protein PVI88_00145 [Nitrosopumilaceae archaeon]|jgi:uncharacterized protein with gpF-like domain
MTDINKKLFLELLKLKRKEMGPGNRARSKNPVKGINWIYPFSVERKYAKWLQSMMQQIIEPATEFVRANVGNWIKEYAEMTADAYPGDLRVNIEDIEKTLKQIYEERGEEVRTLIADFGFQVSGQNIQQWKKFTKKVLGVEFVITEPWEIEIIKAWAEDNFTLVKSLSQEYIKKVNTIVSEAVTTGRTAGYLVKQPTFKEIEQGVFRKLKKWNKNYAEYRTRLIARDQVGKLQGQFTQRRQEDAGIDSYFWVTAGDERVRGNPAGPWKNAVPSHYIMSGVLCRWDNVTLYSENNGKTWKKRKAKMPKAHPGQEIQCRCSAIPNMIDLVEQVDKLIENEKAA